MYIPLRHYIFGLSLMFLPASLFAAYGMQMFQPTSNLLGRVIDKPGFQPSGRVIKKAGATWSTGGNGQEEIFDQKGRLIRQSLLINQDETDRVTYQYNAKDQLVLTIGYTKEEGTADLTKKQEIKFFYDDKNRLQKAEVTFLEENPEVNTYILAYDSAQESHLIHVSMTGSEADDQLSIDLDWQQQAISFTKKEGDRSLSLRKQFYSDLSTIDNLALFTLDLAGQDEPYYNSDSYPLRSLEVSETWGNKTYRFSASFNCNESAGLLKCDAQLVNQDTHKTIASIAEQFKKSTNSTKWHVISDKWNLLASPAESLNYFAKKTETILSSYDDWGRLQQLTSDSSFFVEGSNQLAKIHYELKNQFSENHDLIGGIIQVNQDGEKTDAKVKIEY